jgi:hypothetical protein
MILISSHPAEGTKSTKREGSYKKAPCNIEVVADGYECGNITALEWA